MVVSQVKTPREFKFVGGPSRKRRRRTGPNKAAPPTPKPSRPPSAEANHDERGDKDKSATCAPVEVSHIESQTAPLDPSIISDEAVQTPVMLSPATSAAISRFHDSIDWSSGGFMDPFMDPGPVFSTSFDQTGGQLQLPFYFGPDLPFIQLGETSSTDNSPQGIAADMTAQPEEVALGGDVDVVSTPSAVDEIFLPSLEPTTAPCNISSTITQLLNRYDQEYCVMPLTHDFEANPFRFNAETGRGSQLLLHCILALSYKHINRDTGTCSSEAKTHKKKALQMLKDMEGCPDAPPIEANFLDAVLILMTLDCATSAHGPWVWYLKRAHKLIQATESAHVRKTPRMQARIEMLVWWDVTLALTSRQGCVLSEATILSLFSPSGASDATFYSVSGCPEALFKYMIRLGAYAREFEIASTMTCVKFNMEPVLEVERGIRAWTDPDFEDSFQQCSLDDPSEDSRDLGELANYKEDLHHCAEAWRYALLIYVERVFKWQRDQASPSLLSFLARKALNHVASCRRNTMLQKQLLLPVFLAGCETQDEHFRQEAREYCSWWNEKTRYDMFLTATALLEEVWASEQPNSWWGSIIDQKSRNASNGSDARQYLFG